MSFLESITQLFSLVKIFISSFFFSSPAPPLTSASHYSSPSPSTSSSIPPPSPSLSPFPPFLRPPPLLLPLLFLFLLSLLFSFFSSFLSSSLLFLFSSYPFFSFTYYFFLSSFINPKIYIDDGQLYTFGSGKFGALGHNDGEKNHTTPKLVEFFSKNKLKVKQVALGENHTIALTSIFL